jgi:hypothetical protein
MLDEFHVVARQLGVRMHCGSNPSLFVRASFHLLLELREQDPEDFRRRVAVITEFFEKTK